MKYTLHLLLLFVVIWAGCTDSPSHEFAQVPGVTDSTIVIGSWTPLSGPAATWGAVGRGTEAYFRSINDEGGIHGRKIRFILKDDQYQPAKTVAVVKEMAERDHVFAFAVGVGTATGMAARNYIDQYEIPWVGMATGSAGWAYPPVRHIFATYPLYFDEAATLINYGVNELGFTRFAMLYLNDDYGKSGLVGAQMALETHGLELAEAVSVEVLDTDLTSQTLKLQEAGAEAVLVWGTPKHAAILVGTAAKLGFQPQWMSSSTLSDAKLMNTITEGLWTGAIFTAFAELPTSDHPLMQKYRAIKAKYGPDVQSETFFYAGILFAEPMVEGLKQAGRDLTRDSFIAAMESLNGFQGTGGVISFGPHKRQGTRDIYIARTTENGGAETLTDWITPNVDVDAALARLHGTL